MAGEPGKERPMQITESQGAPAQSLAQFLCDTGALEGACEAFARESEHTLRIDVDGGVWLKPGAAIAYRGDIAFQRLATLDARSVQDAVMRETAPLVRAVGHGRLYCGQHGSHVHVVRLAGESFVVAWADLLAFEERLNFESSLVSHGVGIAAGGLVAVKLSGHGAVGIVTHGQPLTLRVAPGHPVSTDPHATLAWSGELTPVLKTELSWRSALGHGGHEPVQMFFEGAGFVVVQPHQDPSRFGLSINRLKRIAAFVTA
jgi:uncharacterized protein (AIM24 family)